jgi:sugar-specific transcriptional regulator TrmB
MHYQLFPFFLFWFRFRHILHYGEVNLSLERIVKTLMSMDLSETDAQVYVFLALNGPHIAREISRRMNLNKAQIYRSLRRLQKKDIALATAVSPAVFSVIPFERLLDLLVEIRKERESALRDAREELLSSWQKVIKRNSQNN